MGVMLTHWSWKKLSTGTDDDLDDWGEESLLETNRKQLANNRVPSELDEEGTEIDEKRTELPVDPNSLSPEERLVFYSDSWRKEMREVERALTNDTSIDFNRVPVFVVNADPRYMEKLEK